LAAWIKTEDIAEIRKLGGLVLKGDAL